MPSDAHPGAPIDLAYLAAQTMGDTALTADLLALFVAQTERLAPAIGRGEGHALHTLAGAALAIGARALGEALREAEARLARGEAIDPAGLSAAIAAARDHAVVVLAETRTASC